ncbi:hypothetical protein HY485_03190 [Candidatus Woesearchaeota archaeon]|nr:hypothetical protein [Candidatus Woesearchaeota archaeon]
MTEKKVKSDLQQRLESEGWRFLGRFSEEALPTQVINIDLGGVISLVFEPHAIPRVGLLREPQLDNVPKYGAFKDVRITDAFNGDKRIYAMRDIYVKDAEKQKEVNEND